MIKSLNSISCKTPENYDKKENYLSIQISLDGFSFCEYQPIDKKYVHFESFQIELEQKTPENLLKSLEEIFSNNTFLQQKYKQVSVLYVNDLVTLVPNAYFDENHLNTYLKNSVKVLQNDFISFDLLKYSDTNVVYIPYANINNFLYTQFGEFDFTHNATALIDGLLLANNNTSQNWFCVNVHPSSIEIVYLKEEKLIFYNTFHFQTEIDFIYYVLFVMEQLQLDPNSETVLLLGAIDENSDSYKIAYQYIRNLTFYNKNNNRLTEDFQTLPKHANYTLFNQF